MRRAIATIAGIALVLVIVVAVVVVRQRTESEAPAETTATSTVTLTPLRSRAETGLSCDNVVSQADIDALGAKDKLTLPFEPCTAFRRDPTNVTGGYHDSPTLDFFVETGTKIMAPWDGILEFYPLSHPMTEGGYGALVSNTSKSLSARIYVFEDESNPAYGSFLGNSGELREVKRGDLIGFVGSPLPSAMTETGATVELELADWAGLNIFVPTQDDYWARGQMNFYILQPSQPISR